MLKLVDGFWLRANQCGVRVAGYGARDSRAPTKADGCREMGAKVVFERTIRPHLPALSAYARLILGWGEKRNGVSACRRGTPLLAELQALARLCKAIQGYTRICEKPSQGYSRVFKRNQGYFEFFEF